MTGFYFIASQDLPDARHSLKGKARALDADVQLIHPRDFKTYVDRLILPRQDQAATSSQHVAGPRQGQIVQQSSVSMAGSSASSPSPATTKSAATHTHTTAQPTSTASSPSTTLSQSASTSQPSPVSSTASQSQQSTSLASTAASASTSVSSSMSASPTTSASASSSSSSALDSPTAAMTSQTAASAHHTLAGNTTLMVVVIVGSIVGASVVLFGLTWLCRRSGMAKRNKSRGRFYTGNWSPRSGGSEFSYGAETSELFGNRKKLLDHMRPSPMPSLKPEGSRDVEAGPGQPHLSYNYGTNYDLDNILAPHKLRTPAIAAATPVGLTLTGSTPNPNGRGWALFDQPLEALPEVDSETDEKSQSVAEVAEACGSKLFVVNASERDASIQSSPNANDVEQQSVPVRRPTFIQRLLDQPMRATPTNLNDRLLKSENSVSSRRSEAEQTVQKPSLPPSRRESASNGILSAFSSMRLLGRGGRPAANIPDDSDFEGTIGAPDKELPRASRMRKGQRFVCDATSSSSCSEDSASVVGPFESPVTPAQARYRPNGQGLLWFDGHGTPRTPGLAGVGASWARASAQLARYPEVPQPPHLIMSTTAHGRQLLGAPGMPPSGARLQSVSLAELKRQQAFIDNAEQQQRLSIPQEGDVRLTSRIASWWNGTWDAEWPSPTSSAAQQAQFVDDNLLSPRSKQPVSLSSSPLASLEDNDALTPSDGEMRSSSPVSTIGWTSEESDAVTLRGETEVKFWEKQSLARAQADLLRMGSLRPKFAAVAPLETWLTENGPSDGEVDGQGATYEPSLKTPVIVEQTDDVEFDEVHDTDADGIAFESQLGQDVVAHRSDSLTSEPVSEHPSEASLPSYRTDPMSPQLEGQAVLIGPPARSLNGKDSAAAVVKRGKDDGLPAKLKLDAQWLNTTDYKAHRRQIEWQAREARSNERRAARKREEKKLRKQLAQAYNEPSEVEVSEQDWPLDAVLQARYVRQTQRHRRSRDDKGGRSRERGDRKASHGTGRRSASAKRSTSVRTHSTMHSEYETETTSAAAANVLADYCTPVLRYEAGSESSPA